MMMSASASTSAMPAEPAVQIMPDRSSKLTMAAVIAPYDRITSNERRYGGRSRVGRRSGIRRALYSSLSAQRAAGPSNLQQCVGSPPHAPAQPAKENHHRDGAAHQRQSPQSRRIP